jgi:nucleotide-binding universal stress UspA family protein
MPNKIVVPTDFSANSKAGIRFAIQLASQNPASTDLVFYHCMELLKPMRWTDAQYASYVKKHLDSTRDQLVLFVEKTCEQMGAKKPKFECVVREESDPKKAVIEFAKEIKASAICMATRGAGKLKKIIGTNSSGILATSPVPVYVIPSTYRKGTVKDIIYASDLENVPAELKRVNEVARPLKANVAVYHYTEKIEEPATRKKLLLVQDGNKKAGVAFHFQKLEDDQTFAEQLETDLRKSKASMAVLFTNQKRGWFDKVFQSSQSAEVSFNSKVPLLVFAKE